MPRLLGFLTLILVHGIALRAEKPPVAAESELRDLVERYVTDREALARRYPVESAPERFTRLSQFYDEWKARVEAVAFDPLHVEGRIAPVLLRPGIDYQKRLLSREVGFFRETAALLPFAEETLALNDARLRMDTMDPAKAGATLDSLADRIDAARKEREGRGEGIDRLPLVRAAD